MTTAHDLPRTRLTDGTTIPGPAVITEDETTIILPRGYTATGRADGCIDITRDT
jgi:N-methylhydantoinase A